MATGSIGLCSSGSGDTGGILICFPVCLTSPAQHACLLSRRTVRALGRPWDAAVGCRSGSQDRHTGGPRATPDGPSASLVGLRLTTPADLALWPWAQGHNGNPSFLSAKGTEEDAQLWSLGCSCVLLGERGPLYLRCSLSHVQSRGQFQPTAGLGSAREPPAGSPAGAQDVSPRAQLT